MVKFIERYYRPIFWTLFVVASLVTYFVPEQFTHVVLRFVVVWIGAAFIAKTSWLVLE